MASRRKAGRSRSGRKDALLAFALLLGGATGSLWFAHAQSASDPLDRYRTRGILTPPDLGPSVLPGERLAAPESYATPQLQSEQVLDDRNPPSAGRSQQAGTASRTEDPTPDMFQVQSGQKYSRPEARQSPDRSNEPGRDSAIPGVPNTSVGQKPFGTSSLPEPVGPPEW